jgi:2-dehydropantoate 2-reductase
MKPRIAVFGAGAIGGYVGGHLAQAGHDVTFIDPWPEHVEAIRARGLEITGMTAEERLVVKAPALHLTEVQAIAKQRPIDIAFIAVKSYDTVWATAMIAQYLSEGGYVVSLQNCINEERIAGVVGWGRTVGTIAATLSAELVAPGRVVRTGARGGTDGHAVFRVGEVHGRITPRVRALGEMMACADTVHVTTNLWGERWSKLCVNGMRNGVSAATGLSGNERDRHDAIRRFSIRLGAEAVRIGQALGYALEEIGNLKPELLARAGEGNAGALEEVEALILARSNAAARSDMQRPSMAQDMAKERRTEIDFINDFIAEQGAAIGIAALANAAITRVVKQVERGEIPARPENVATL